MIKRLYPPHYLALSILAIIAIDYFVSVELMSGERAFRIGIVLLIVSLTLTVSAARLFSKAGTGIVPFSESTVLVAKGAYRFTRNPMYLGMFVLLVAVSFLVNSLIGLLVLIPFFLIIRNRFVLKEEEHMEAAFGEEYLAFKSRVRRWL